MLMIQLNHLFHMPLTDSDVKNAIRNRWDLSSQDYDTHEGHGIKSQEERNAWQRVLHEAFPGDNLDILDVGCGTGVLSMVLAEMGHNVIGVDLSEKMISVAIEKTRSSRLKAKFLVGDAEKLKFEDESFDAVVSRHLLWTLPTPEMAFGEWKRVLKNGGRLAVIDGEWKKPSMEGRMRRLVAEMGVLFVERKNPWKNSYSAELCSKLPHPHGLSVNETMKYFENSGLSNVTSSDLSDIRELQKTGMPFRRRISFSWTYYLVRGIKTLDSIVAR